MGDQSGRVYYEIIDEVCNKLTEEGPLYDIDRTIIYALQNEWIKNIESIQSEEPLNNAVKFINTSTKQHVAVRSKKQKGSHGSGDGGYVPDDGDSEYGSVAEVDSEDDIDDIEENIGCYMMCLFVKVAKSKNKWKCNFKQGFINVDNNDIPFSTATGELEW
ncbi:hypothetical protein PAEPH01_2540 [Pancytospora epiphaga]|nr:hypothetical protein PAEPH01_2540 [Pancytospora epiphaga]